MEEEKKDFKIIVIIPAFNEEGGIGEVISKIPKTIEGFGDCKCVVIDDGSSDKTGQIASDEGVEVIRHSINKGVGNALATGIDYALKNKADVVVNIDADGQFNPEEIISLVKPILNKKADLVVGNRFNNGRPENMPLAKYYGNKLMNIVIGCIAGEKFQDVSCGFRGYNQEALLNLNLFGRFTYTQESFIDLSFKRLKIKQVSVAVKYFKNRKSKVANSLFKYAWNTILIIVRSLAYFKPLRFFAYPGLILILTGFLFIGYLLMHRFISGVFTPFKAFGFIGGGLAIFGLLLVSFGLLADIIDKLRQNQEKLLYFEKKKIYEKK